MTIMFQPIMIASSITAATQMVVIWSWFGCVMPPVWTLPVEGPSMGGGGTAVGATGLAEGKSRAVVA